MIEFDILESVIKMGEIAIAVEHETHHALEHAAKAIEKEAKAEIGNYQDQSGPFVAWAELADATKEDRVRKGYSENDPLLREGDLRDSIGHSVGAREATVGSNSDIAVYQELGTAKIPPRSFLGGAAVRSRDEVVTLVGEGVMIGLLGGGVYGGYLRVAGRE